MDAKSLFTIQLDDAEYQLRKVFEGLSDDAWDKKAIEGTMSPRETAAHLVECYVAGAKHFRGEEHSWGTFQPLSSEPMDLLTEAFSERDKLKEAALNSDDPNALKAALAYSASHDFYHVGQLCSLRQHLDPAWDAYSIYRT